MYITLSSYIVRSLKVTASYNPIYVKSTTMEPYNYDDDDDDHHNYKDVSRFSAVRPVLYNSFAFR